MEVEQDTLQGSIMALVRASVASAEGDTYKELSDAMVQVRASTQPHTGNQIRNRSHSVAVFFVTHHP